MLLGLLADLVVLIHLTWIAFILGGLALAWRRPALAWPHLAGLVLLLALNLGGWYCPLTYLEMWLRHLAGPGQAYAGSFLGAWLERLVYLPLPEAWLRVAGALWAGLNLAGYGLLWRRLRRGGRGAQKP